MSNKETLHFKIGLSGSSPFKQPEFRICVNDKEYCHQSLTSSVNETEFFEFDIEIEEGDHCLQIDLCNKLPQDTHKDDNGNITADLLLNIDYIEVDEIELTTIKWTHSEYHPNYPKLYKLTNTDLPDIIKNCVNLGWNGRWSLPFTSPFYFWLLENI